MTGKRIKRIPKSFLGTGDVSGYKFERIKQSKTVAMYSVQHESSIRYEVFIRKVKTKLHTELYPNKHAFGISAWSYGSKELADRKYKELNKQDEK